MKIKTDTMVSDASVKCHEPSADLSKTSRY